MTRLRFGHHRLVVPVGPTIGRLASCGVVGCVVTIFGLLGIAPVDGSEPSVRWKTRSEFHKALTVSVDVYWSGSPLRGALERLARRQQVAMMLDRRIDPDRPVKYSVAQRPLEQQLLRIASEMDATLSFIGSVVYIGPRELTANLSTVAADRRRDTQALPGELAARVRAVRAWHWDHLAVPRELIIQLADQAGVSIDGIEQVPHDLWPEGDLPALPWTDRLTLVLAGFDLTFQFVDGGRCVRLVPFPKQPLAERSFAYVPSRVDLAAVKETFPNATIDAETKRVTLVGTAEEHSVLDRLLRNRQPVVSSSVDRTLYTMKVEDDLVGAILKTLEQRSDLTFEFSPTMDRQLYHRVTFDVSEVKLDELLDKVLTPAGLTFQRQGNVIKIGVR